ncbi:MAG TPA: HAMP domain-containing sensor histidine kinase [Kofleriaceae bacterium]|jgi:signal transduction histidine kinase
MNVVKKRRLASRMVLLAIAQMVLLQCAAVTIWYFTVPHHFDHVLPPNYRNHARGPHLFGVPLGPALTLLTGFVVLGVGALLTARWIVSPVEKLSQTANAIGSGDLQARSGVSRDDEIGVLGTKLDDMAGRLELLVASERELLANVAHELRTPLSRIGVALDLAAEGDGNRARASLEDIAVDVAELETIVDDILTAMRLESGRATELPLRRSTVEPATIAASAADRLKARHPDRTLELDVAPGLPVIDVDPALFRRVIDNLLENAHKYTPDGNSTVELRVGLAGNNIVFEVADRGVGIPADDLPHVFDAFFRGDRSRSRQSGESGGVGLGLTLSRRIAIAHGGTIALASEPGKGTVARLSVPSAAARA